MMDYKEILFCNSLKLFIIGMNGEDPLIDLKDCLDDIKDKVDGLVWRHHGKIGTEQHQYLESIKGSGEILCEKWNNRMCHARNACIWSGTLKENDIFITIDVMEKLKPEFFDKLGDLLSLMINNNVRSVYLHGKHFLFFCNEELSFVSSPHCGVAGTYNNTIELTQVKGFENSEEYFINMRPAKRNASICYLAFLRYYFYPCSNHIVLSIENQPELINKRAILRKEFLRYYNQKLGRDMTWETYKNYIDKNQFDEKDKYFINNEIILNNYYRYSILGERAKDVNNWNNLIKI